VPLLICHPAMNNKILYYTRATVAINFPEDRVCCKLCPLLQTYSRNQCMRTGELIADTNGTGMWCPLEIAERKDLNADSSDG